MTSTIRCDKINSGLWHRRQTRTPMKMGKRTEIPGLHETGDGYVVRVNVTIGSLTTSKRKQLPGASKAQALIVLEQMREAATAECIAKTKGEATTTTLSACARRYVESLAQRKEQGHIKPVTMSTHMMNLERFILPFIGRLEVTELKPKTVVAWMRWVETLKTKPSRVARGKKSYAASSRPYARATLANAWRTLRAFCAWLTVDYDLHRNPARDVRWDVVGEGPKEKPTFNLKELSAILEATHSEPLATRAMVLVGLVGAMRASELAPLEWGDVNFEERTITIKRSRSGKHIGKPKTVASRRVIVLPPEVFAELEALRAQEPEATVMFRTSHGTYHTAQTISYVLERCAKRAGIKKQVSSHVLRRTTNNLVRKTAGELVARKITGHTTQVMTEHYASVDHEERSAVLRDAFGGALGAPKGKTGTGATLPLN